MNTTSTTESSESSVAAPLGGMEAHPRGVTARAVILGILLAPASCYWVAYTQIRANSTDLTMMSLMAAAFFPLIVLMGLNGALGRYAPRRALARGELLTVYGMLATTVGLAGGGFIPFLACTMPAPTYFGTPENHWANWFRFLKPFVNVTDKESVTSFYEGQSQFFTPNHLQVWAMPILFWSAFLLVMLFWGYCVNTLLRRSWMDEEKLIFPIAQIPLEITRDDVPFWHNRMFHLGIAVPVVIESINSLHFTFFPTMPFFHIKPDDVLNIMQYLTQPPWNSLGYFSLAFYPIAIGLTFLLPTEISFSCWFFYFLCKAELLFATAYGFHDPGAPPATARVPYLWEQATGAWLGLALLSLYASRRHLTAALRKALTGRGLDDRDEPLSYRTAYIGLALTSVLLVGFAVAMGMAWHVALLFFAVYLLFLVTYTRIRAEAGLPWVFAPPFVAHGVLLDFGGFSHYNTQDLTALSRFQWFEQDYRSHMMPNQMDAMKYARNSGISLRGLSLALGLATVSALIGSWLSCLHIFYTYGATSARVNHWYSDVGRSAFDGLQGWINNATQPTDVPRFWAGGVGVLITWLLVLMRARFVWWPLHPIGYLVANTFTMDWLCFPVMIGWACKALILRYGGLRSYRAALPFFVGLVVGDIVISSLWTLLFLALNIPGYRTYPI
ncbi:MAG: hypothetical protein JO250_17800 [Armatimonadetes bacterium]|nr:hypothetical protein [Armatimonadota bacterium]